MNTIKSKLLCFLLFLMMHQICLSQTGWISQVSGTSEHLQSVCFVNDMTGWVVGYAGKILKTTNGGTNWISQTSPTSNSLLSVYFVSSSVGWAVGALGVIIATGNGGTTWAIQPSGITSALNSVCFISSSTGWAVGEYMTVLKTSNSGTNWIPLLSSDLAIISVFFNSSLVGYIAGNGFLYKTTNGGLNWTAPVSNPAWAIYSVHFPPGITTTGYAVGMGSPSPPILKSTDSGNNWAIQPVPLGNALTSVYFTNVSTGWAAGWIGTIMYTSNGGTNWSDQTSNTSNSLRSIYFVNSLTGWTVGDLGTILKTTSGGITGVNRISNEIPSRYSLSQNYPNPFNPKSKIKYQIANTQIKNQNVKLVIYNSLGEEMEILVDQIQQPGIYEVEFDGSKLSSGVYYYKITTGEFIETKKMLMIK